MFALQRITRTAPKLLKLSESQCRTFLVTPPRVRVSLIEKLALGAVFYIGVMAIPMWVSCNINNYNAKPEE